MSFAACQAGPVLPATCLSLHRPTRPTGAAVLVLAGSSGAREDERAGLLAEHGAVALALRWFGGPGQQPGPYEVPLETFHEAVDLLEQEGERLGVLGSSFGAEAALLAAARDPRTVHVAALAPTPVVWSGVDEVTGRGTSHWTWGGEPVPYVPFDAACSPSTDPPSFRPLYEQSLRTAADRVPAATIAVEEIGGDVLVVGGEDDQVWPGADFARAVADRRSTHGLDTAVVTAPAAGHRVVLPGERPVRRGRVMNRGGTPAADAALGLAAWPHLCRVLGLRAAGAR